MEFVYSFPAVRGMQAMQEYYIAMVPLRMLPKLFPEEDSFVPPEYRAQRKLNTTRIPVIKKYILNNRNNYVFSALAASIDGEFSFVANPDVPNLGVLSVSMDARFLINDGQHRKAAILEAIQEDDSLLDETISIVLYRDKGLARSQQMFTDLNKHAVKTSNSIAELYDSRDDLAVITRDTISKVPFLRMFTDKEKDILGKYSSNLFTLSTFYNANKRILRGAVADSTASGFLALYWMAVAENLIPWAELTKHEISKVDLRENYIVTQAVIIQVLGRLGNYYFSHPELEIGSSLAGLRNINWRRDAREWKLRTIRSNGRMINNEEAIILTCNVIKNKLGIPLDENELQKETLFLGK